MRMLLVSGFVAIVCCFAAGHTEAAETPNIVYILADDLGIGDVGAFNEEGKIATPAMDRLAAEGMRFTDAHSGSAVCTPTRYGVLTGRYAWRTRLQSGVLWGYSLPLIAPNRLTVASLLQQNGYDTAAIGKWHLGLQWSLKDSTKPPADDAQVKWDNIDFSGPIVSGPLQVGFDHFYGISASLDMHPYVYISDDRATSVPTRNVEASGGMKTWRAGPIGDDFRHIDVLGHLTDKAVEYVKSRDADRPFFLYFPLPAPHTPIVPTEEFQNQSGLNPWGDFVMQVDATVDRVLRALEDKGISDNTLFIVTSDNGATPKADFQALAAKGHQPSSVYRGNKADIFEGGHRVAFVARWPDVIAAGSSSDATICHTDLLATAADLVGAKVPDDAGEDSFSLLPLMKQAGKDHARHSTIHHSINGSFAIRRGKWKLAFCPGSGGWSAPRPAAAKKQELPALQLFDLSKDIGETENVAAENPSVVEELTSQLHSQVRAGRTTTGPPQRNDVTVKLPGS